MQVCLGVDSDGAAQNTIGKWLSQSVGDTIFIPQEATVFPKSLRSSSDWDTFVAKTKTHGELLNVPNFSFSADVLIYFNFILI